MASTILFLLHRAPWPPDRGDRIRSWYLFQALRRIGPVHVAALADTPADAAAASAVLEPLSASLRIDVRRTGRVAAMLEAVATSQPASVPLFHDVGLARHVAALIGSGTITHIVAFSSQMAQYIPADCTLPLIIDFVDVDSAKFEAYAAEDRPGPMRWVNAREGRLLARYEAAIARRAKATLFVSDAEAALFVQRSGIDAGRVDVLRNGIDVDHFAPHAAFTPLSFYEDASGASIVFTGQMDYRPNVEAVTRFAGQTMPRVSAAFADARFAIVGRAPTAAVRALAALPRVTVTGEVADTRPWLAAADIVVAPLAVARGVQNKVLEAMAMARPVVASAAAAAGIDVVDGTHLLIADGAAAEAAAIERLLNDPDFVARLGAAARVRMIERYGWDAAMAPLACILRDAA